MAPDVLTLSRNNSSSKMGTPILHEFKKQASFFFREKIKTARLALTDVTPAQLMAEEATEGNPCAPDSQILSSISRAAFELDDYCRIIEILRKRFSTFDKQNWRVSYNSLIVLQHLLTHGPESVAKEFKHKTEVFNDMGSFQYIDDKGFNWGLAVRKKSERIVKLLEMGDLLKEERDRARKVSRGIQGFGSFCDRSSMEKVENLKSWCSLGESDLTVKYESGAGFNVEKLGLEEAKSLLSCGFGGEEDSRSSGEEEHHFYGTTGKQNSYSLLTTYDYEV